MASSSRCGSSSTSSTPPPLSPSSLNITREDIPRVHNPSAEEFLSEYYNQCRPVIITGMLPSWPCSSRWSLDGLKELVGHKQVFVRTNTSSSLYAVGKAYTIQEMKLSEYITDLQEKKKVASNRYMAVVNINQALQELRDDFTLPAHIPKLHRGPFLWVAPKGHYEFMHFDPDDNFLCILSGRKTVRLFSPKYFERMYVNELGSLGYSLQSRVDFKGRTVEDAAHDPSFPLFRDLCYQEAVLEAGEILFFPFGTWHQVTTDEVSVSMNIFCGDEKGEEFLSKLMKPLMRSTFKYWLLNIVEQNRCVNNQFRFMQQQYDEPMIFKTLTHFLVTRYGILIL